MGGGARARRSEAGSADSGHQAGSAESRERQTLPRPRRSRPFSPPLQLSWLLPHLGPRAQVTSLPRSFSGRGGARVSPMSLRLAGARVGRPVRGWRSGAGRRLRALSRPRGPRQSRVSGPWRRERAAAPAETRRLSAAPRVTYRPRPGAGGDHSALSSPHLQVRAATRVPAVPGGVVGCRYGNGWCPDGACPGWEGMVKAALKPRELHVRPCRARKA